MPGMTLNLFLSFLLLLSPLSIHTYSTPRPVFRTSKLNEDFPKTFVTARPNPPKVIHTTPPFLESIDGVSKLTFMDFFTHQMDVMTKTLPGLREITKNLPEGEDGPLRSESNIKLIQFKPNARVKQQHHSIFSYTKAPAERSDSNTSSSPTY